MGAINTKSQLEAATKFVHESGLKDLRPSFAILDKYVSKARKIGRNYRHSVILTHELGISYDDGSGGNLNDSIAAVYGEIVVDPSPVIARCKIAAEAASRLSNSKQSMQSAVGVRMVNLKRSLQKIAELDGLYGRSVVGLGVISAITTVGSGTETITFTDATWAPGIWSAWEGAPLDAYSSGDAKRNANADIIVSSVDHDNKQIVVTGNTTDLAAVVATDRLVFKGSFSIQMYGLFYQFDTSGTVFNIDNSNYALWKSVEHAVGGQLTMAEILEGLAKADARAGLDEDCVLLVSPITWQKLNDDLSALREFGPEIKNAENGAKSIKFNGHFGMIEIVGHAFMMEGYAKAFPKNSLVKVGSEPEITFKNVASDKEETWTALEDADAYQARARFSFQYILPKLGCCVLYSGITN